MTNYKLKPETNKNLQLVQMLRGIAALLVVFYHATVNYDLAIGKIFCFDFFKFGGSGVDIFFVLSGFIITYTSFNNISHINKLGSFLRRRIVRILPTYWIIITGFLVLQFVLPSFYKTKFSLDFINVLDTFLLLPDHVMLNGVSWTLTYELYFYLIFTFSFLIPSKRLSFIIVLLYSLVLMTIPILGFHHETSGKLLSLVFFPMNLEFFMGVVIAVIVTRFPSRFAVPFILIGAVLFLFSGILTDQEVYLLKTAYNRVILFGIPSFFLVCGLIKYELASKIDLHGILLSLGEASYSLYLIHLPFIAAICKIVASLKITNTFLAHLILLVSIAVICYISFLFFKYVEKPIIASLNRKKGIRVANEI